MVGGTAGLADDGSNSVTANRIFRRRADSDSRNINRCAAPLGHCRTTCGDTLDTGRRTHLLLPCDRCRTDLVVRQGRLLDPSVHLSELLDDSFSERFSVGLSIGCHGKGVEKRELLGEHVAGHALSEFSAQMISKIEVGLSASFVHGDERAE